MSSYVMRISEKQPQTQQTSFFIGAFKSVGASTPEFSVAAISHSSAFSKSIIGREKAVVIKDSKVVALRHDSKLIPVKDGWNLNYIRRIGNTLVFSDTKTFRDVKTNKVLLEIEQKTDVDAKNKTGVLSIEYKGLFNGRELFKMNGDEINLTPLDPALYLEKRV